MPGRISPVKDSVVARILPKGSRSHRRTGSASNASPSHSQTPGASTSSQHTAITANRSGPTRGRPLIFAAMNGTEVAEDAPETDVVVEQTLQVNTQNAQYIDEASAQAYPSPTSPVESGSNRKPFDDSPPLPPVPQKVEEAEPRRRRKLSKPNKNAPRVIETHVVTQTSIDVGEQTESRQHRNHHHDRSTTPVDVQPPAPHLGSPIQIQRSQSEDTGRYHRHKRSGSGEHNKLTRKPRDGGVKPLTERQLEKLSSRNANQTPATTPTTPVPPTPTQAQVSALPPPPAPMTPEKEPVQLPSPPSPEDYAQARSQRRGKWLEKARPGHIVEMLPTSAPEEEEEEEPAEREPTPEPPEPTYYPLTRHVDDSTLLAGLLPYLTYYDWCVLNSVSNEIRKMVYSRRDLACVILERYLRTVGYTSWVWKQPEPLILTLQVNSTYCQIKCILILRYSYDLGSSLISSRRLNSITSVCTNR